MMQSLERPKLRPSVATRTPAPRQRRLVCRAAVVAPTTDSPAAAAPSSSQLQPQQTSDEPQRAHVNDGIMVQAFNWESHKHGGGWYNHLLSDQVINELASAGVTYVWLPPPSHSVSPEGYLPGQLYNLSSAYGDEAQLTSLCAKLRTAGIEPLADIVINHRCADSTDEHGRYNDFADDHDHEGHAIDWGRWAITGDDHEFGGKGNKDTGDDFWGAPDLDHANEHLREALVHWLQHLRDNVGFRGWRFDFAKGYAAEFIREYVHESGAGGDMNVGELWVDMRWGEGGTLEANQDAARQKLCDWLDGHGASAHAFDFPTKGILQYALDKCEYWRLADAHNKPPGLIGWWPSKAVTFISNHDTCSTQRHWPFPDAKVGQGYAYLLTHPGMPCIFWDHLFTWGSQLKGEVLALIKARQAAGVGARSKVEILACEGDVYVARTTGTRGALMVKLGPRYDMGKALLPRPEDGWAKAAKGADYCVWLRLHDDCGSDNSGSSSSGAAAN